MAVGSGTGCRNFRITERHYPEPMNTRLNLRPSKTHKAIEPSWVTLGQACILIMMVILVQF